MRGWIGSNDRGGGVSVWMDSGVYTGFYIDYGRSLAEMTLSLFRLSTMLMSASGVITPTEIRRISDGIYQVFAPLPQDFIDGYPLKGLNIVQFSDSWLKYSDGTKVPSFAVYLTVDSQLWWTPGMFQDTHTLAPVGGVRVSESAVLTIHTDSAYNSADSANLSLLHILNAQDSGVSILYTPQ